MIILTGGSGFIGSAFAWKCNQEGVSDLLIVDDLNTSEKWKNLVGLHYRDYLHKKEFFSRLLNKDLPKNIDALVHLGACSVTTEKNMDYLMENNYRYTQILAEWAVQKKVRFIYASSAATYGNGEHGFDDTHAQLPLLMPINRYGYSKHLFDLYALHTGLIKQTVGLKFFNVFGPNEYHKEDMRSVVCKAYSQILETGVLRLFKSYRPEFEDGGQKRDFIYVKDCVNILWWFLQNKRPCGIFNIGTGKASSWNTLANAIFSALDIPSRVEYIDMPETIQNHYQYYTEANMTKLRKSGYTQPFHSLEEAIHDYVRYLKHQKTLSYTPSLNG